MRLDDRNYLVSLTRDRNHLELGDAFTDSENGIKISFDSEVNNVATVTVRAPVEHRFREAVAGPAQLDWHIYESVVDLLQEAEKARINQVQNIVNQIRNMR